MPNLWTARSGLWSTCRTASGSTSASELDRRPRSGEREDQSTKQHQKDPTEEDHPERRTCTCLGERGVTSEHGSNRPVGCGATRAGRDAAKAGRDAARASRCPAAWVTYSCRTL